MLKLVVSNATEVNVKAFPQPQRIATDTNYCANFTAEVLVKNPHLYVMTARDPFNYLTSEFTLEIEDCEDEGELGRHVVCNFSSIADDQLYDWTNLDGDFIDIIVVEFQMKILEAFLLFCESHNVPNLVIKIDEADSNALGIYLRLATHKDKTPEGLIQLTFPVNSQTFDKWKCWMDKASQAFRYALWRKQRNSPDLIPYFKSHVIIRTEEEKDMLTAINL